MISFDGIPSGVRVPWAYIEFNNSNAQQGPSIQPYTTLIMGQKLAAGTQAELELVTVTSEAQARTLFGAGSQLHMMCRKYFLNDLVTPVKCVAIDDHASGVAATGTLLAAGSSIKTGVLALYIGGIKIPVLVTEDDTPAEIATAITAAITAEALSPVSAVVNDTTAEQVDLTAKNKGVEANDVDIRINYADDDVTPENLTLTITAMASGAQNPDVSEITAILPDNQYNVVVMPWTDPTNRGLLETELAARFGPLDQNDGVAFMAKRGTVGELETYGNGGNSPHVTCMGMAGPSSPYEWSAAYAGASAKALQIDPARPLQVLPIVGISAPSDSELFSWTERNMLLTDGIATYKSVVGQVQIERAITMYQLNGAGASDISYLNVNTMFTLSFIRYDFRNTILRKYPRHKLADDGTRFGPGQPIMTPKLGKAEAVAMFASWEDRGLVEGVDQFKRDLVVERNASDPDRLDFLMAPDLVNQLRVAAGQIKFLL